MTNKTLVRRPLDTATVLVRAYVGIVAATLVALVVLGLSTTKQATPDAWVHAVIVAGVAILLPLRLRSARQGDRGALRAVGIIAGVLLMVNAIESGLALFPLWMRVEMVLIAILMATIVVQVARAARRA